MTHPRIYNLEKNSGSGEVNTTSNEGGAVGLALPKSGVNLPFKTIEAGTNVTIDELAEKIRINASGGSSDFTYISGDYSLTTDHNGDLIVDGNLTIENSVAVKGSLTVIGELDNLYDSSLTVYGSLLVVGNISFSGSYDGLTSYNGGSLTVRGNCIIGGDADFSGYSVLVDGTPTNSGNFTVYGSVQFIPEWGLSSLVLVGGSAPTDSGSYFGGSGGNLIVFGSLSGKVDIATSGGNGSAQGGDAGALVVHQGINVNIVRCGGGDSPLLVGGAANIVLYSGGIIDRILMYSGLGGGSSLATRFLLFNGSLMVRHISIPNEPNYLIGVVYSDHSAQLIVGEFGFLNKLLKGCPSDNDGETLAISTPKNKIFTYHGVGFDRNWYVFQGNAVS